MPTLLRYDLTTSLFPLQASPATGNPVVVTMAVVASNPNPNPDVNTVRLQGIIVTLPVGSDGTDFTEDAQGVAPVAPINWTLKDTQYNTGTVSFVFAPSGGAANVGSAGLNFVFNSLSVNRQTGTVEVDIMEGSGGCQPPNCPVQPLYVTKFPNGWGQVSYTATPDPPIVPFNSGPTLQWSGPAGATYAIDYYLPQSGIVHVPAPNAPPLANAGVYPGQGDPPLQLTQNTTFYLSVTETINNVPYKDQQEITVTVIAPAPKITKFCASVKPVSGGYAITFQWATQDTQYCTLSGSASELTPNSPTGGWVVNTPQLAGTYTLTAWNGNASDAATVSAQWTAIQTVGGLTLPAGIAVSPDGTHAYAANGNSIVIYKINGDGTLTAAGSFNAGGWNVGFPQGVAISPDGTRLYVVLLKAGIGPGSLQVYSSTGTALGPVYPVGQNPWGVAASPDGTRLYVLNTYDRTISTFAVSSNNSSPLQAIGNATPLNGYPSIPAGMAVSSDNTKVYAGLTGAIAIFQASSDTTTPLKATGQVTVGDIVESVGGIGVGNGFPYVAVVLQEPGVQPGQVLLRDPATLATAAPSMGTGNMPMAAAVAGSIVYVTCQDGITVYAPSNLAGGIGC